MKEFLRLMLGIAIRLDMSYTAFYRLYPICISKLAICICTIYDPCMHISDLCSCPSSGELIYRTVPTITVMSLSLSLSLSLYWLCVAVYCIGPSSFPPLSKHYHRHHLAPRHGVDTGVSGTQVWVGGVFFPSISRSRSTVRYSGS